MTHIEREIHEIKEAVHRLEALTRPSEIRAAIMEVPQPVSDFTVRDVVEQLGILRELAEHAAGHIKAGNGNTPGVAELLAKIASCAAATQERIAGSLQ